MYEGGKSLSLDLIGHRKLGLFVLMVDVIAEGGVKAFLGGGGGSVCVGDGCHHRRCG